MWLKFVWHCSTKHRQIQDLQMWHLCRLDSHSSWRYRHLVQQVLVVLVGQLSQLAPWHLHLWHLLCLWAQWVLVVLWRLDHQLCR